MTNVDYELTASKAADHGSVNIMLKILNLEEVEAGVKENIVAMLLRGVENAVEKERRSEALELVGANQLPDEIQMKSIDILVQHGKAGWLCAIFSLRDVHKEVGLKVVEAFAENGCIHEIVRLAKGEKCLPADDPVPDYIQQKAKDCMARCVEKDGGDRISDLDKKDRVLVGSLVPQNNMQRNGLAGEGMLSNGTVKKPASPKNQKPGNNQKLKQ